MKIGGTRSTGRPTTVATRQTSGAAAAAPSQAVGVTHPVADITTLAGIPEGELTPKVRVAIEMLLAEVQRLRVDIDQAQKRVGYLEKLADEDSLVPVANRRAFVRELGRIVAYAERYGAESSVLYFDINDFKNINDTYGHAAGDAALRQVGKLLLENIRESDIVGRLGGDEFGVILAQANAQTAVEKAATLADAVESEPFVWEDHSLAIGVSYGIYSFSGQENAGEALARADKAMYLHKQSRSQKAS
ncbi:MAG: GGDEF domain-containing protein [Alphaproteobacteria bacterium]